MLRKAGVLIVTAVLGAGAAFGVAACGEDREGEVEFEGGTETSGTGTSATETAPETEPETETESGGETAPEVETEDDSGGATAPEVETERRLRRRHGPVDDVAPTAPAPFWSAGRLSSPPPLPRW